MAFRVIEPAKTEASGKPKFRVIAPASKPTQADDAFGALSNIYRAIPFADEVNDRIVATVQTAGDIATGRQKLDVEMGKPVGSQAFAKRYAQQRARSKAAADDYVERKPVRGNLAKGVGLAVQAIPAMATGGASILPAVAKPVVGRGFMASSARAAQKAAPRIESAVKASTAAGLGAQVAGYGSEGSLAERQQVANETTLPAMAVGAALPAGIAGASWARRKVAGVGDKVGTATARIANRVTGGAILDAETEAAKRLGQALKADGLGPAEVRAALEQWQRTGASSPALLDLAGENTRALLRAAGAKPGAGRDMAVRYTDQVAGDLQDNAIRRTRALTPTERRPAGAVAEALEDTQGRLADEMYPEAYAAPARVTPQVMDALSDEPGKAALRRARAAAVARRNPQQVAEIDALLAADEDLSEVSGGTLDRVRIAMAGRGAKAQQSPDTRDIAGGLFSRAGDIDAALDEIPGLAPARATYRGMQAQRDALDLGRSNPFSSPDEYADELAVKLERATPDDNPYPVSEADILGGAQVGLRSEIERSMGAPAEGSTGYLNKLSSGTNPRRVLDETFGEQDSALYRDAISREVEKLQNARFINPNSGSQTAPRLLDEALVDLPPMSKVGLLKAAIDKIRRGTTLTDAEREALMSLGTRQIEAPANLPMIPEVKVPERLMTPAMRQQLARVLASGEGARQANDR